MLEDAQQMLKL